MAFNIKNPQISLIFWFTGCFPSYQERSFPIYISLIPKTMFSIDVYLFYDLRRDFKAAHIECWKGKEH
jgi:hypothetical protein